MADSISILLVNDIPDHQRPYESALRARGYHLTLVRSASDALIEATRKPPGCIVIDIRLPDMNGWDLCERLKSDPRLRSVPIVMLAQDTSPASVGHGQRVACNAWLARPTVGDDLVRAIEHVLAQGTSEPASAREALLGVSQCPGCDSEHIRAGVGIGAVQYYSCTKCRLCWRVPARDEATA
jgi:CheY-like chemotaxis protein